MVFQHLFQAFPADGTELSCLINHNFFVALSHVIIVVDSINHSYANSTYSSI